MNRYLVSFDFWNTLVLNVSYKKKRLELITGFLRTRGFERSVDEVQTAYASISDRIKRNKAMEQNKYTDLEERIAVLFLNLGIPYDRAMALNLIENLQRPVLDNPPPLILGVRDVLQYLSSFSDIVCVSDTGMTQGDTIRRILDYHGIEKYFKHYVFSEDIGHNKPDRRMFYPLLNNAEGIPTDRIYHIGDLLDTDVLGATNAGIHSIWFTDQVNAKIDSDAGRKAVTVTGMEQVRGILKGGN